VAEDKLELPDPHAAEIDPLGIGREDWEYLRDQILERLPDGEVESVEPSRWGYRYRVTLWIDGLNGASHPVTTRWLVQDGHPPRLVTCWV
jgi:hypothetical protein